MLILSWVFAVKGRYTAPVLILVEALDMILTQLAMDGFPFHKVYAISGSAQQHGSVYWTQGACSSLLKNLDPSQSLLSQLQNAFATQDCPMWMDSTTSAQCSAIEEALGGAASVTALTGTGHSIFCANWLSYDCDCHVQPELYFSLLEEFVILLFLVGRFPVDRKVYWATDSKNLRNTGRHIPCNGESVSNQLFHGISTGG